MFDLLLSLELKSHILQSNSHFTPELSVCALGDLTTHNLTVHNLTTHNLAFTARLLECQRPISLVSTQISSIYLFFVLGSRPNITLSILYVAPAFQELAKQTIISSVGCSPGIRFNDLWSTDLPQFTKGFLNGRLLWVLWRMASNSRWQRASNRFTWSTNVLKMFGCTCLEVPWRWRREQIATDKRNCSGSPVNNFCMESSKQFEMEVSRACMR